MPYSRASGCFSIMELAGYVSFSAWLRAQWLNMPAFWPVTDFVGVAGARSFLVGYMVSVGIGLTVMAAFVSQYFDLAWKEEEEMEGGEE